MTDDRLAALRRNRAAPAHPGRLLRRLRLAAAAAAAPPRPRRRRRCSAPGSPQAAPTGAAAADPDAERSTRTVRASSSRLASAAARLGPHGGAGLEGHPPAVGTSSTRLRGARLGAGLTTVPPQPASRPAQARSWPTPRSPRTSASARRAAPRSAARATGQPGRTEGFCPQVPQPVLVHPEAQARRPGRRPVRGRRLPGARRPGLDLPGPRPQRVRPLGGAQGPAQLRRRRTRSPRPSPSGSSWPRSSTR